MNSQAGIKSGLVICFALALCIFGFQNCGFGAAGSSGPPAATFTPLAPSQGSLSSSSGGLPELVTNCLSDVAADACVFQKNPVAEAGQALSTATAWYTAAAPLQNYAVKIANLDASGYLQNDSIVILGSGGTTGSEPRVQKKGLLAWRTAVDSESSPVQMGYAETQISAYYWLNSYLQSLKASPFIGANTYASGNPIQVYPYVLTFNGSVWENAAYIFSGPLAGSIIVGYGETNTPAALSAEVLIHEFTHGLINLATSGAAAQSSSATLHYCLDSVPGLTEAQIENSGLCCINSGGCMRAMHEGLADFFASAAFPTDPTIGESFANSVNGLQTCQAGSPYRNVLINASLTPAAVFDQCQTVINYSNGSSTVPRAGEIYTMGTVYTSVLWQIRADMLKAIPSLTVGSTSVTGAKLFEAIVYEHFMSLGSGSTFSSSRIGLKSAAAALVQHFGLQLPAGVDLGAMIDSEFTARGIN